MWCMYVFSVSKPVGNVSSSSMLVAPGGHVAAAALPQASDSATSETANS